MVYAWEVSSVSVWGLVSISMTFWLSFSRSTDMELLPKVSDCFLSLGSEKRSTCMYDVVYKKTEARKRSRKYPTGVRYMGVGTNAAVHMKSITDPPQISTMMEACQRKRKKGSCWCGTKQKKKRTPF